MTSVAMHSGSAPLFGLKRILAFDGLTCVAMGLLLVVARDPLASLFGLPPAFLFYAGALLFPCAALMFFAARQAIAPLVWLVILGNVAWAVASLLAATVLFQPTAIGTVFVLGQAIAVLGLATLEYAGLRRRDAA